MKKYLFVIVAIMATIISGCKKSSMNPDKVKDLSYAVGFTAGTVADILDLDDEMKKYAVAIIDDIVICTPSPGQKFVDAWTPIIDAHISDLVDQQKITEDQAKVLDDLSDIIVRSMDWFCFVKYPEVGKDIGLIEIAIKSFCDGFLSIFNTDEVVGSRTIDQELYDYLTK